MISWNSEAKNQTNLDKIAEWWAGLEGTVVKCIEQTLGTTTDSTGKVLEDLGGPASTFKIQSPTLANETLSYKKSDKEVTYPVQRLELNLDIPCLRVTTTSNQVYTFTPN